MITIDALKEYQVTKDINLRNEITIDFKGNIFAWAKEAAYDWFFAISDKFQEGVLRFWKALTNYNGQSVSEFIKYAKLKVKYGIADIKKCYHHTRQNGNILSYRFELTEPIYERVAPLSEDEKYVSFCELVNELSVQCMLTKQEKNLLKLKYYYGKTNRNIAKILKVSETGIHFKFKRIFDKIYVSNLRKEDLCLR